MSRARGARVSLDRLIPASKADLDTLHRKIIAGTTILLANLGAVWAIVASHAMGAG